jgi:hypothetical protein
MCTFIDKPIILLFQTDITNSLWDFAICPTWKKEAINKEQEGAGKLNEYLGENWT